MFDRLLSNVAMKAQAYGPQPVGAIVLDVRQIQSGLAEASHKYFTIYGYVGIRIRGAMILRDAGKPTSFITAGGAGVLQLQHAGPGSQFMMVFVPPCSWQAFGDRSASIQESLQLRSDLLQRPRDTVSYRLAGVS